MQILRSNPLNAQVWLDDLFSAKAVGKSGILRRAVRDVDRKIGREVLLDAVRKRGFHLIECGGQFIIICNPDQMQVIC